MKNNKGFTLVELLAVIVIISLLMIIAVPSSIAISNKINEKLLTEKLKMTEKAAILWAQDNKKCFLTAGCSEYPSTLDTACVVNTTSKTCNMTFEILAVNKYLQYDEGKKIINPMDKEKCLNNYVVVITYTKKSKTFTAIVKKDGQNTTCPK